MEETLAWTNCLEPIDGKIVWMKAHDERWKNICWHVGLCHAAAHQHWRYGLSLIALNLNRQPFNRKLPILEIIKLARSLSEPRRRAGDRQSRSPRGRGSRPPPIAAARGSDWRQVRGTVA